MMMYLFSCFHMFIFIWHVYIYECIIWRPMTFFSLIHSLHSEQMQIWSAMKFSLCNFDLVCTVLFVYTYYGVCLCSMFPIFTTIFASYYYYFAMPFSKDIRENCCFFFGSQSTFNWIERWIHICIKIFHSSYFIFLCFLLLILLTILYSVYVLFSSYTNNEGHGG